MKAIRRQSLLADALVAKKAADNAELPEPDRAQFRTKLQSMGK